MPEIGVMLGGLIIIIPTVVFVIMRRPRKPEPEKLASEVHKENYIASGDVTELFEMTKSLESEQGG